MILPQNYFGCDIGKKAVDVFGRHSGRPERIANDPAAVEAFVASLDPAVDFVVLEATGSHDRLLRHALAAAGVAYARVNPLMARRFAEARGQLAKTDRIDARGLAEMGALFQLTADRPPAPERERLAALLCRRAQLVEARAEELRHRDAAFDTFVIADVEAVIADLSARIKALGTEIDRQVKQVDELVEQAERYTSVPGVGPITAITLLALMPELGTLSPRAIASLAGLAPFNDDSGNRHGRRHIRGGRPRMRRALYMAALSASRTSNRFKAFYEGVALRSGSKKVAIIAVARKLIVILNALQRDKTKFA